jgi:hypothetical protein
MVAISGTVEDPPGFVEADPGPVESPFDIVI